MKVCFHPQAWQNDNAIDVDAEGPTVFEVPDSDTQDNNGRRLKSNSDTSDQLQMHPNAPQWVRNWTGPFWIELQ